MLGYSRGLQQAQQKYTKEVVMQRKETMERNRERFMRCANATARRQRKLREAEEKKAIEEHARVQAALEERKRTREEQERHLREAGRVKVTFGRQESAGEASRGAAVGGRHPQKDLNTLLREQEEHKALIQKYKDDIRHAQHVRAGDLPPSEEARAQWVQGNVPASRQPKWMAKYLQTHENVTELTPQQPAVAHNDGYDAPEHRTEGQSPATEVLEDSMECAALDSDVESKRVRLMTAAGQQGGERYNEDEMYDSLEDEPAPAPAVAPMSQRPLAQAVLRRGQAGGAEAQHYSDDFDSDVSESRARMYPVRPVLKAGKVVRIRTGASPNDQAPENPRLEDSLEESGVHNINQRIRDTKPSSADVRKRVADGSTPRVAFSDVTNQEALEQPRKAPQTKAKPRPSGLVQPKPVPRTSTEHRSLHRMAQSGIDADHARRMLEMEKRRAEAREAAQEEWHGDDEDSLGGGNSDDEERNEVYQEMLRHIPPPEYYAGADQVGWGQRKAEEEPEETARTTTAQTPHFLKETAKRHGMAPTGQGRVRPEMSDGRSRAFFEPVAQKRKGKGSDVVRVGGGAIGAAEAGAAYLKAKEREHQRALRREQQRDEEEERRTEESEYPSYLDNDEEPSAMVVAPVKRVQSGAPRVQFKEDPDIRSPPKYEKYTRRQGSAPPAVLKARAAAAAIEGAGDVEVVSGAGHRGLGGDHWARQYDERNTVTAKVTDNPLPTEQTRPVEQRGYAARKEQPSAQGYFYPTPIPEPAGNGPAAKVTVGELRTQTKRSKPRPGTPGLQRAKPAPRATDDETPPPYAQRPPPFMNDGGNRMPPKRGKLPPTGAASRAAPPPAPEADAPEDSMELSTNVFLYAEQLARKSGMSVGNIIRKLNEMSETEDEIAEDLDGGVMSSLAISMEEKRIMSSLARLEGRLLGLRGPGLIATAAAPEEPPVAQPARPPQPSSAPNQRPAWMNALNNEKAQHDAAPVPASRPPALARLMKEPHRPAVEQQLAPALEFVSEAQPSHARLPPPSNPRQDIPRSAPQQVRMEPINPSVPVLKIDHNENRGRTVDELTRLAAAGPAAKPRAAAAHGPAMYHPGEFGPIPNDDTASHAGSLASTPRTEGSGHSSAASSAITGRAGAYSAASRRAPVTGGVPSARRRRFNVGKTNA